MLFPIYTLWMDILALNKLHELSKDPDIIKILKLDDSIGL